MHWPQRATICLAALALFSAPSLGSAQDDIRVVTYNAQSGNAHVPTVAELITEIGPADIWGLQEVAGFSAIHAFRDAMDADNREMWFELGHSGGSDRLAIVYDKQRFEAVDGPAELQSLGGSRAWDRGAPRGRALRGLGI